MIKVVRFLIFFCVLFGCNNSDPLFPPSKTTVLDDFHYHVTAFELDWGHQVTNTSIIFVNDIESDPGEEMIATIGRTIKWEFSDQVLIIVSKKWWDSNTDFNYRELLIYHELGHAVLGRSHNRQPVLFELQSIMQPFLGDEAAEQFANQRKRMVAELFAE